MTESQWVSVRVAARVSGVSERTVWRWARAGRVETRETEHGAREIRRDSLPAAGSEAAGGTDSGTDTGTDSARDSVTDTGALSVGVTDTVSVARERLAGYRAAALAANVKRGETQAALRRALADVEYLRRALADREQSERELRVLMLRQSEQLSALAARLEALTDRPALPPAREPERSARRPWWAWWRR